MTKAAACSEACGSASQVFEMKCHMGWQVARNYTAQTLNLATGGTLTQADVIAVSAMEAVGVAPAIELHNQISGGRPPLAIFCL
jgi:hypothetical protein